jgi:hypothetical protein
LDLVNPALVVAVDVVGDGKKMDTMDMVELTAAEVVAIHKILTKIAFMEALHREATRLQL